MSQQTEAAAKKGSCGVGRCRGERARWFEPTCSASCQVLSQSQIVLPLELTCTSHAAHSEPVMLDLWTRRTRHTERRRGERPVNGLGSGPADGS